jgi:F0F1-type ATP synthase assembly protein I
MLPGGWWPSARTAAVIAVGALIGWAAGSLAWGFLVGAIVGIPVGLAVTIRRYGALTR